MPPKRVTAFVGSPRRKFTCDATRDFLDRLEALGGVRSEILLLGDYTVEACRGCKLCFMKGEEFCPGKDDRDVLIDKMMSSDGVVFASPNYSFQVSGVMKTFLDLLGFMFHRPRFHGRVFTSIVVQGFFGGRKIVKYLSFVARGLGFRVVKGGVATALEPMTKKELRMRGRALGRQSRSFHRELHKSAHRRPALFELMVFRMARQTIRHTLEETDCDHMYYSGRGWFESDYYYPVRLGPPKKPAGALFDLVFGRIYRSRARSGTG